jgi:hypothetical protein
MKTPREARRRNRDACARRQARPRRHDQVYPRRARQRRARAQHLFRRRAQSPIGAERPTSTCSEPAAAISNGDATHCAALRTRAQVRNCALPGIVQACRRTTAVANCDRSAVKERFSYDRNSVVPYDGNSAANTYLSRQSRPSSCTNSRLAFSNSAPPCSLSACRRAVHEAGLHPLRRFACGSNLERLNHALTLRRRQASRKNGARAANTHLLVARSCAAPIADVTVFKFLFLVWWPYKRIGNPQWDAQRLEQAQRLRRELQDVAIQ